MRSPSRRTSPRGDAAGGSRSPITAMPVSDLPAPDSPTTPSTSPRPIAERHVVDGDQLPAARWKLHPQVAHLEQRPRRVRSPCRGPRPA